MTSLFNLKTSAEAAEKVFEEIQDQLLELIRFYVSSNPNEPDYMLRPLKMPYSWMSKEPYRSMELEYEYAKFNFQQLSSIFEMIHGTANEFDFAKDLGSRMKSLVQQVIDESTQRGKLAI